MRVMLVDDEAQALKGITRMPGVYLTSLSAGQMAQAIINHLPLFQHSQGRAPASLTDHDA